MPPKVTHKTGYNHSTNFWITCLCNS